MKLDIKLDKPILDIHPDTWKTKINMSNFDNAQFRNLHHFKNYVSKLTQKQDMECGVSYKEALNDLIKEKSQYNEQEYESIRDLVRMNLLKRGLISEDIYEAYKYASEGTIVDIAKVVLEDPECFLTPVKSYTNYFYELYINVSYNYNVSNRTVRNNAIKLLSTIEELERQHIYIKVTLVDVSGRVDDEKDLLTVVPLFDYRDIKSIKTMSAVVNERLLRKFMFAMSEDVYGENLSSGYGHAIPLPNAINIGDDIDEIELFSNILDEVVTPGTR